MGGMVHLDNEKEIFAAFAKMEKPNAGIVEARKELKKVANKYKKPFKAATPTGPTGDLKRSVKVKSKSKRGMTFITLLWEVDYAGYVNFWKKSAHSEFVTMKFNMLKPRLDTEGRAAINKGMTTALTKAGFKVT